MVVLIVSLAIALVATPVAARVANALGVIDRPGSLKVHTKPVPYLGGLAVFAGAATGPVVEGRLSVLVPMGFALALGTLDDARDLAPWPRLIAQIGIGILVAVAVDTPLQQPFGTIAVAAVTVVLVNAVNLIDGLDGLASGVALGSAAGFAILLEGDARSTAWALTGALAGFLVFNRPPARIYLGDGGAYLLGTTMALLLVTAWDAGGDSSTAVASLLLLAVPAGDLAVTLIRRFRGRRPLFAGDRSHVYDQLVGRGLSAATAALTLVVVQAVAAALAVGGAAMDAGGAAALVLGAASVALVAVGKAGFLAPTVAIGDAAPGPAGAAGR